MASISTWSTTAASNNSAAPDGWPENMPFSGVNDAGREMMAALRTWYEDAEWIKWGDTTTYVSGTQFKISGSDVTSRYSVGRRVRVVGSTTGTIYGIITVSAFSTDTTVTVSFDSGSMSNETLTVSLGIIKAGTTGKSFEPTISDGTITTAKIADSNVTTAKIADSNVTTAKIADANVTYAKIQNVSATSRILGRKTSGAGVTEELTLSETLDFVGSAAQGDILYRGASGWTRLGAGTSGQYLKTLGTGANPAWATLQSLTLATPQATTSGTSVDFTGIPSGTKRVTIMFADVYSNNGSAILAVQIGPSGGVETSGYMSKAAILSGTSLTSTASTSHMIVKSSMGGNGYSGVLSLTLESSSTNTWVGSAGAMLSSDGTTILEQSVHRKAITGALSIVRVLIATAGSFTAGEVNIMYE